MNNEMIGASIVLACVCFLAWFVWCIFRWIDGLFTRTEPQPNDAREAARKLLETPVPTSDPKMWVRYKCEPELCAAPQVLVHVPSDAEHRETCERCQEEWKRSGRRAMPHATN